MARYLAQLDTADLQEPSEELEKSVARYLAQLDTADLQEPSEELAAKTVHLKEKLVKLESEMQRLAAMERLMLASPDQQISLTDPDSRSMATSGRGSGVVGYNVLVAVDTEHHLIVTHEVTNDGSDRAPKIASGGFFMSHSFSNTSYGFPRARRALYSSARRSLVAATSTRRRCGSQTTLQMFFTDQSEITPFSMSSASVSGSRSSGIAVARAAGREPDSDEVALVVGPHPAALELRRKLSCNRSCFRGCRSDP